MATSTRGRSSSRTGSRNYSFFGSNWGTSAQSGTSGWGSGTSSKRAKSKRTSAAKGGVGGYKSVNTTCQNKISSYRTLMGVTKGTSGKFPRPTPSTLNTFANWINKGAVVQMVSPSQVARWAKATSHNFNPQNPTPTACKNVLCKKFGKSTIKAVCRTATGKFLVATAPTYKGRAFSFPR
jgi:hypothetical protein